MVGIDWNYERASLISWLVKCSKCISMITAIRTPASSTSAWASRATATWQTLDHNNMQTICRLRMASDKGGRRMMDRGHGVDIWLVRTGWQMVSRQSDLCMSSPGSTSIAAGMQLEWLGSAANESSFALVFRQRLSTLILLTAIEPKLKHFGREWRLISR